MIDYCVPGSRACAAALCGEKGKAGCSAPCDFYMTRGMACEDLCGTFRRGDNGDSCMTQYAQSAVGCFGGCWQRGEQASACAWSCLRQARKVREACSQKADLGGLVRSKEFARESYLSEPAGAAPARSASTFFPDLDPARLNALSRDFEGEVIQDVVEIDLSTFSHEELAIILDHLSRKLDLSLEEQEQILSLLSTGTSIATGIAVGVGSLTPVGAAVIGATVVFSASGYIQYEKDIRAGRSPEEALQNALVKGSVDVAIDLAAGKVAGAAFDGCKALAKSGTPMICEAAGEVGKAAAKEGGEEGAKKLTVELAGEETLLARASNAVGDMINAVLWSNNTGTYHAPHERGAVVMRADGDGRPGIYVDFRGAPR